MEKNHLIEKLKNPNTKSFFVLDIDSTLVSTHQRNQKIILDFCSDKKSLYPEECLQLQKIECRNGDYGFKSALTRLSFQSRTPGFSQILDLYWRERFFSNHYLYLDQPNPGATQWVQNMNKLKIPFIYLTARHHSTMWSGTLETMAQMGFPIDESCLHLKADKNAKDEIYKVETLRKLKNQFDKKEVIFIDNEPVVLCQIKTDFSHPTGLHLVWFNSCHSGRMHPPDEALEISHFLF